MRNKRKINTLKRTVIIFCVMAMLVMIAPTALAADYTVLNTGSSGSAVTSLQSRLLELGYIDSAITTGYYGALTKTAVTRFQSNNGLTADGIAGSATITKIDSSTAKKLVLNIGNSGEAVTTLQARLNTLGYFSGSATGYYGSATKSAVAAFQSECGITSDGIAGPKTRVKLFSASAPAKSAVESASTTSASRIADIALTQVGKPYVLGTQGPSSYDCSGLAYYSMINAGFSVSRMSAVAYSGVTAWAKITDTSSLKKGDLLFFHSDTSTSISHMGIYVGGGEFVQASSGQGKVMTSYITNSYWARNLSFARRVS